MKVSATVNLDNYESIKFESNESKDVRVCLDEVKDALTVVGTQQTISYVNRVLSAYAARITALQDSRED